MFITSKMISLSFGFVTNVSSSTSDWVSSLEFVKVTLSNWEQIADVKKLEQVRVSSMANWMKRVVSRYRIEKLHFFPFLFRTLSFYETSHASSWTNVIKIVPWSICVGSYSFSMWMVCRQKQLNDLRVLKQIGIDN